MSEDPNKPIDPNSPQPEGDPKEFDYEESDFEMDSSQSTTSDHQPQTETPINPPQPEHQPQIEYTPEPAPQAEQPQPLDQLFSLKEKLQNKFSDVSAGSGSKGVAMLALMGMLIGGIYMLFSSPDAVKEREQIAKAKELEDKKAELLKTAKTQNNTGTASAASLAASAPSSAGMVRKEEIAELPKIAAPQAPSPPPPPVPSTPSAPVFPSAPVITQAASPILSDAPPLLTASNAPPPIIPSNGVSLADNLSGDAEKRKQELLARRKVSSLVTGNGGNKSKSTDPNEATKSPAANTSFLGFDNGATSVAANSRTSAATSVQATNVGDLDRMILQGKIMTAVLESAINTDLPGSLRAIVSRDVYAEQGDNILIPKGSRLVGTYSSSTSGGKNRVGIKWSRLIRPDGIDIAIDSDGTDELGRTGVSGFMDDKFWLKIGSAVLTSYIIPVVAKKLLNVKDSTVSTTTSSGSGTGTSGTSSSTTTTGSSASQQLQDTIDKLQEGVTAAVKDSMNTEPTIMIDQGTMINVYVNKDIIFTPEQVYGGIKILQ